MRLVVRLYRGRQLEVLLLYLPIRRLVPYDQVHLQVCLSTAVQVSSNSCSQEQKPSCLVRRAALVRSEHEAVGCVVQQTRGVKVLAGRQILEVGPAAGEPIAQLEIILQHHAIGRRDILVQIGCYAIVLGLLRNLCGGSGPLEPSISWTQFQSFKALIRGNTNPAQQCTNTDTHQACKA